MWYAYILESVRNKRFYIGNTDNLKRRFEEHNQGRGGKYTSKQGKFKLIFYEAYVDKKRCA
jgi:putative endonuclease